MGGTLGRITLTSIIITANVHAAQPTPVKVHRCTCVYTCMQLHVACVLCARVACPGDVCDARVPGVRACARVCARSLETTAQSSVVRLGSGRWLPASREGGPPTFWVSESPGSEPEAPPSPDTPPAHVGSAEGSGLLGQQQPVTPGPQPRHQPRFSQEGLRGEESAC